MDEVTQAVENLKKEWSQVVAQLEVCIAAIESCGKLGKGTEEASSLPRLNGTAQDALQLLNSLQCRLDLLAEQLPTFEEVQSGQATLGSWKEQYQRLRVSLRSANLQAKVNIGKAAQEEVGPECQKLTWQRIDTQPPRLKRKKQSGIWFPSARQVTRIVSELVPVSDYICSRIILATGFFVFSLAVLYVVSRRIGLLTLQRKLAEAIRSGSVSAGDVLGKVQEAPAPTTNAPPMYQYDEL